MNNRKTIAITIHEGRVIRDLFVNNFLEVLKDLGYKVIIFSPVVEFDAFVDRYKNDNVDFLPFPSLNLTKYKKLSDTASN